MMISDLLQPAVAPSVQLTAVPCLVSQNMLVPRREDVVAGIPPPHDIFWRHKKGVHGQWRMPLRPSTGEDGSSRICTAQSPRKISARVRVRRTLQSTANRKRFASNLSRRTRQRNIGIYPGKVRELPITSSMRGRRLGDYSDSMPPLPRSPAISLRACLGDRGGAFSKWESDAERCGHPDIDLHTRPNPQSLVAAGISYVAGAPTRRRARVSHSSC